MRVIIAAGGSGGHIFPAMALAVAIKASGPAWQIAFVGSDKALDRRIFEREGAKYYMLSANKLPSQFTVTFPIFFVKLFLDTVKAFYIVMRYRPDIAVGFGGYVSFSVIFASRLLRIKTIVHEQNVVPGRANLRLFSLADRIAVSFEDTREHVKTGDRNKVIFTGNPLRREALSDDKSQALKRFGLDANKFTILVIGGSQGSHFLNRTVVKALEMAEDHAKFSLQIIHLTGVRDYEYVLTAYQRMGKIDYRVHSFIDRIEEAYSASDLIVTRSGASAIFEIACFARPMILIPYPLARSHQGENARVFSEKGAALVMEERTLTPESFKEMLFSLINDPSKRKSLGEAASRIAMPDAASRLAVEVVRLAGGGGGVNDLR